MTGALPSVESFGFIAPELILGGGAVLLFLLAAAVRRRAAWHALFPWLGGLAVVAAGSMLYWANSEGGCEGSPIFDGLLACDPLATFFRSLVLVAVLASVVLSVGSPSLPANRKGEYYGLLLVMAMGMSFLAAANNLLMIFVAMETVSLCSYLLVGWDSSRYRSSEAGLKYVLFGGVASGVMLFGMSLLYGLYGDLSLQGLHEAIRTSDVLTEGAGRWAAWVALAFILTGFGFKIAAVPFHQWCPDAYEGAPTPFTALLSVGPKAAGFAILLRFIWGLFAQPGSMENVLQVHIPWPLMIGLLSALTMTLGNLVAIVQDNLKRLLAYSSIAHAGYMLMGVVAGGIDGFESVAMYMAIYVMMNMGAFAVVSAVDRATGSERIQDYRGLGKRAPWLAITMVIFLVSLTGLPPTAGFIGKLYLFAALVGKGGTWYWALAMVGIANSVVSLFYYARVMRAMYLDKAPEGAGPVRGFNSAGLLATVMAVPVLVLGVFWQPLAVMASWSARFFH
jgi:NADH-quinone oxidoreductase subunit N